MTPSNKPTPPHKHSQLTKKKKILLGTLIPFSLIIIALAVFLGMWFGCKKKEGGLSTNPQKWLVIDDHTIDNPDYKVVAGTDIYIGEYGQVGQESEKLGHDDLNVKAFSDAHGGVTDFCVKGIITFGFMVDPNMDFHLMGANGSEINLKKVSGAANGIIVGQTTEPTSDIPYNGNMYIENSVNFNVSSDTEFACGVNINSTTAHSTQTINGTFTISSIGLVFGVSFYSLVSGSVMIINGTFTVVSTTSNKDEHLAFGVFSPGDINGSLTINGTFVVNSTSSSGVERTASGVEFENGSMYGHVIINGIFTVSSVDQAYGVSINQLNTNSSTTINGIFSVSAGDYAACGVYFINTDTDSTQTINGTFTLSSSSNYAFGVSFANNANGNTTINGTFTLSASTTAYGVKFFSNANGTLSMTTAQFFSNKVDSGNIFTKYQDWGGSYKWNGTTITKDSSTTTNDTSLSLTTIYDTQNDQDYNFSINLINNALAVSKETFNNKVENALDDYIESDDCGPVAEQWLRAIVEQISSV